jgi:hypothetical protein
VIEDALANLQTRFDAAATWTTARLFFQNWSFEMASFFHSYVYKGVPYTKDENKSFNVVDTPIWFSRNSLHRATFTLDGPYDDPLGRYRVESGEALLSWETKQPPPGTEQALLEGPRPIIQSILRVNRTFVTLNALLYRTVDPDAIFVNGDFVAVWFGQHSPAEVIGRYRPMTDPLVQRNNQGARFTT